MRVRPNQSGLPPVAVRPVDGVGEAEEGVRPLLDHGASRAVLSTRLAQLQREGVERDRPVLHRSHHRSRPVTAPRKAPVPAYHSTVDTGTDHDSVRLQSHLLLLVYHEESSVSTASLTRPPSARPFNSFMIIPIN